MIIVIATNPQGQPILLTEGAPLDVIHKALRDVTKAVGAKMHEAKMQANGRRPSGLIVPPTEVPPDAGKPLDSA